MMQPIGEGFPMTEKNIQFLYEISFKDGRKESFPIELCSDTLALVAPPPEHFPDWAKLSCHRCSHCPLDAQTHPHCPVAANITAIIKKFATNISHEEVRVTIRTQPRSYERTIALQDALRSIFGIYMATSGCPVMDKLRPLVLTHLPFATIAETAYRALSMYALAQCLIHKRGGKADLEFKGLGDIYKDVEIVNRDFHKRLKSAGLSDAALNAIGNLNCYAQFTQMALEPERLKQLEELFKAYY
jgi:hypothetical protein